jgi:hypothetical protein
MWKEQKWEKCMWPSQNKLNRLYRSTANLYQEDKDLAQFLEEIKDNKPLGGELTDYHEMGSFDSERVEEEDDEDEDDEDEDDEDEDEDEDEDDDDEDEDDEDDENGYEDKAKQDTWRPPSVGSLSERVKQHFAPKRKGIGGKTKEIEEKKKEIEDGGGDRAKQDTWRPPSVGRLSERVKQHFAPK